MLGKKRGIFDKTLGKVFSMFGLSPDHWSVLGVFFALLSVFFITKENFILAAVFLAFSSLCDVIDGCVARYSKRASKRGAYLDTILDRYTEAFIFISLMFVNAPLVFLPFLFWVSLSLVGSLMTTYAKAAAKEKGIFRKEFSGGLLERSERLILLITALFFGHFQRLYLAWTILVLAVLSNLTALQRVIMILSHKK
jgi:archaetidylinositol phosphate synthase